MKKEIQKIQASVETKVPLAYLVRCHSIGNPDFRQNPNLPISIPEDVPCETLRQCSAACLKYIAGNGLGCGNWVGGEILHPLKGQFARVSYNGRIWFDNTRRKMVLQGNGKYKYVEVISYGDEITEGLDDACE